MSDQFSEREKALAAEHIRLSHAMQSGVAAKMSLGIDDETSPKQLRTGVNVAMVDHGSLVDLLIRKGIMTREEYLEAIRDGMKAEVERYEKRLSDHFGTKVTLG